MILWLSTAAAATLTVDPSGGADHRTIGAAIEAATSGDTIELAAGLYAECLDPGGRDLTLRGVGEESVIDGTACSYALVIDGGETVTLEDLALGGAGSRGIYAAYSTLNLVRVHAEGLGDSGAHGGVIEAYTSTLNLTDCSFQDNSGVYGGVAYLAWYTDWNDQGSLYQGNQAAGDGGAIYAAAYDTLSFDGVSFSENTAVGGGGALLLAWASDLAVQDSSFNDNQAGGSGGAAYLYAVDPTAAFVDSQFSDNIAGSYGGALELEWYTEVLVDGCTFTGNEAASGGGAVYTYVLDALVVTGSTICANQAPTGGGLAVLWTAADQISNSVFAENQATNGGGLYRYASGAGDITNNTFQRNTADDWGGAYYASWSAGARFVNNLVVGSLGGAGIYADDAGTVAASTLGWNGWSNNGPVRGAGYFVVEEDSDGNVVDDPLFNDWSEDNNCDNDDLRLGSGSPMRNMGDPDILDRDGQRSDIGAYGGPFALLEDHDGDGEATDQDCDDTNPQVHAAGVERCNGYDDNCDGLTDGADASDPSTWYSDLDGDAYGDDSAATIACVSPDGAVDQAGDCDDQNPHQSPGAEDVCEDGFDQDCSGSDDECSYSNKTACNSAGGPVGASLAALACLLALGGARRRPASGGNRTPTARR